MTLTFYRAPFSSATPVASALAELDLPHQVVNFDLAQGGQKKPDYLALNPNGTVPTLVVDGTPIFEAVAILIWLGDNYGTKRNLWPAANAPERLQALSWTTWTYVSLGSAIKQLNLSQGERSPVELRNEAMAGHAQKQLHSYYTVLEQRLSKSKFLLGSEYSLADLVVASTVQYAVFLGVSPEAHPHLSSWQKGCMARPALSAEWGG